VRFWRPYRSRGQVATFFRSAWAAIRLRAVNLDVPIAMALAVGSVAGLVNVVLNRGEIYFDSLTVLIFLLLIGRFLQYQQQRRADDAVGLLFNLTPSSCRIVNNGQALERPIESLAAGDLIEVWSGEIFPADGVVETGASSVNEALLTGESTPAAVSVGSPVHAGSQNVGGVLQVRVKSVGAGTRVGHLMRLVEQGVHDKPQIAQFTDKVGRWFVVIVAMAAVATFFFWLYHQGLSPAIDHSVALADCHLPLRAWPGDADDHRHRHWQACPSRHLGQEWRSPRAVVPRWFDGSRQNWHPHRRSTPIAWLGWR